MQPEQMASDPVHVGVGGSVLAGLVLLVKKLWKVAQESSKEEAKELAIDSVPTVREWKSGQSRIEALLRGIEAQLTEANLPELRRIQAMHGAKLNSIESTQARYQDELEEFRREVRDERERDRRSVRALNERIGNCEE